MGQGFPPCPVFLLPRNGFALMKSMNIAASSELVSRLSSHRRVVAL
ncbi:ornithine decarboxylase isozyme domain protein [Escherichia coli DEC8E]|nr:ornithine decarboxylase isozyme domain protein [Escherichia coli DEC8E]